MNDALQSSLHRLAVNSPALTPLFVFAATTLLFVLALGFALLAWWRRGRVTWAYLARAAIACIAAALLTLLLGNLIQDPRPYLVEHYAALAHASADNGFPSDHTLVAALIAGLALRLDRRWALVLGLGALLVLLGRLAIGAHHTLDVAGSIFIALASLLLAAWPRLPASWRRAVLAGRQSRA